MSVLFNAMSEMDSTADVNEDTKKSPGNGGKQGRQNRYNCSSAWRCALIFGCLIAVLFIINIATTSFVIYKVSWLSKELSKYKTTFDQRIEVAETQNKNVSFALEEVNMHVQELQRTRYDDNFTFHSYILQLFDHTVDKLQHLEQTIGHVHNMSSFQFSNLNEDIVDFKLQIVSTISNVEAEIMEQVGNLSERIDHLSLSRDDHEIQLSLITANLSHILSNHLVQVFNHLDALNTSQQSQSVEVQSLHSSLLSLRVELSNTDSLLSSQAEELEANISGLREALQIIQAENFAASSERSNISNNINALRGMLHNAAIFLHPEVIVLFICILLSDFVHLDIHYS